MSTNHPITYRTENYNPRTARVGPLSPDVLDRFEADNHLSVIGFPPSGLPDAPHY